jgi:hypothetical protein
MQKSLIIALQCYTMRMPDKKARRLAMSPMSDPDQPETVAMPKRKVAPKAKAAPKKKATAKKAAAKKPAKKTAAKKKVVAKKPAQKRPVAHGEISSQPTGMIDHG